MGQDADVIDALVGITPGSPLDAIRARRPDARAHAQATYAALFAPESPGAITAQERFAVGGFVAGLHGATAIAAYYAARLAESGGPAALEEEAMDAAIAEARTEGPYGRYPTGPLESRRYGPVRAIAWEPRPAGRSVRVSPRRSSTCTCWSSTRATPSRRRCRRCWTRLVHDRHRDALSDRGVPVLPDAGVVIGLRTLAGRP